MPDHLSWTSHLFRAFYDEGVRHIYISPGSRSTPLVLAAAAHPGFKKHIVLDERSAAFQALGNGKSTGIPAILICTSGTAAANYHPAVIEARHSGVPMILITADRPPSLRGTGSSQTIDQIKLFGDSVLFFHELGEPVHEEQDYRRLSLLARQTVTLSVRKTGPIHINAPFRKPLEATDDSLSLQKEQNEHQVNQSSPTVKSSRTVKQKWPLPEDITDLLNSSSRPLLIAGPDEKWRSSGPVLSEFADKLNIPVLAEPGSHFPAEDGLISKYDIILGSVDIKQSIKPDLILTAGKKPVGKPLLQLLDEFRAAPNIQFLSCDFGDLEPFSGKHCIDLSEKGVNPKGLNPKPEKWIHYWKECDQKSESRLASALASADRLTDGHVFNHILKIIPEDWATMCSNSFAIRDIALFNPPGKPATQTYTNRGAAGIDGIVSTAKGIHHGSGKPTLVFAGDLAFLHDSNAMLGLGKSGLPIVIIVINNRGGNLFRMLPIHENREYYTDYFETPQSADAAHLAKAHGIPYAEVDSLDNLLSMNSEELSTGGPLVVECKTDPELSLKLRKELYGGL